jgi:4-amino-4-deoxy-L-arabinose transferase-like glycosyltransferase
VEKGEMKKKFLRFKKWARNNQGELILLLLILGLGTLLRFYQIRGQATFLGDEGRDAIIVKRMIVDHKFTLLGPTVSFGNLYLGPIYYYLMVIPLWLTNLDPVGPAMMVASFGVISIFLVYLLGREFFDRSAGLTAAALYAASQLIIVHTRSSWNPNPVPLFALLTIYGIWRTAKDKDGRWLALVGACLGIIFQLHYIAFAFIASVFLIYLILRIRLKWYWYLLGIFSFLALLSSQIFFELRHNFVNSKAMIDLFLRRGNFTTAAGVGFDKLAPFSLYQRLFTKLMATDRRWLGLFLSIPITFWGVLHAFRRRKFRTENLGLSLLGLWILLGVLIIPLYRGNLYDHYLGFIFPTPFLLYGFVFSRLWARKIFKPLALIIFLFFFILNLKQTNLFSGVGPNYQIERSKIVAQAIAQDVGDEKFNLALVAPTGDFMAMNYRYFLELAGKMPEDYGNFDQIDTLYVIEGTRWAAPGELGLWEVGTFGPFKIEKDWTYDFQVQIYKLVHSEE